MADAARRVALYVRVSSDDQVQRQTIQNQVETLRRILEVTPNVELVDTFSDDGVSGTIPLPERPAGGRMMTAVGTGLIDEVWVVRADRLGRDAPDTLRLWKLFEEAGVKLVGIEESMESYLAYGIQALFADDERKKFLKRSAAGMARAARSGRYTGGIVPLGYRVDGLRSEARLVVSDALIWADWSEAGLVRRIYEWLALEGRSCRTIADELNRLGVPTVYQKDGRGVRGSKTQAKWRACRIRNLVVNPVYKGCLSYGRRAKRQREVITAECPAIVSNDVWEAAQKTLQANRIMPKDAQRVYMLRSKIVCGACGLKFCGSWNDRAVWYRCNGRLTDRGPIEGRCPSKMVKGAFLEPIVWTDIERFLRNPLDLLDELCSEINADSASAVAEAERVTLESALGALDRERELTLDLYTKGHIDASELDVRMERIANARKEPDRRLGAFEPSPTKRQESLPKDVLDAIRGRLDNELDDAMKREIASVLVDRIVVYPPSKTAGLRILIQYNFAVPPSTDRGSSPRGA